jgi:hypothetical protein
MIFWSDYMKMMRYSLFLNLLAVGRKVGRLYLNSMHQWNPSACCLDGELNQKGGSESRRHFEGKLSTVLIA